jgi:hypothetical protein
VSAKPPANLPLFNPTKRRANWYRPTQKNAKHQLEFHGKPIKKKKVYPTADAYYLRNHGSTKISNKRLSEIFMDRSKMTAEEHDLLAAAGGNDLLDGTDPISFRAVNAGGAKRTMARWMMMKNIRNGIAKDAIKGDSRVERGPQGHVRLHGEEASGQRKKDNEKRQENRRNVYDNINKRQELLDDFGDGRTAKCIFCGRPVNLSTVSPERMKPGPIGGKYERGNVAPAHVKCNTAAGTAAQYKPDEYYDVMMDKFLEVYGEWIEQGYLGFVFQKNRGKLRGRRVR